MPRTEDGPTTASDGLTCPLCVRPEPVFYHRDRVRSYWQCAQCALVFVPPAERLDLSAEKARYDRHRNDPADPAYRQFLSGFSAHLLARVPAGATGLDFGCGPGPALAAMLRDRGLRVALYDPFYVPDESVWSHTYDFITATEVLEHLHRPAEELNRLFGALKPGGWLGVMTQPVRKPSAIENWHYIRDLTHVCFYGRRTYHYIGKRWAAEVDVVEAAIVFFRRPAPRPARLVP